MTKKVHVLQGNGAPLCGQVSKQELAVAGDKHVTCERCRQALLRDRLAVLK